MFVVGTLLPNFDCLAIAVCIFYWVVCCWLVARMPFFTKSGLGRPLLVALFILKTVAAVAYAKFYALPQYIAGSDTWRFFELSKTETDWLLSNPAAFIRDIFHHGYANGSGNIFKGQNSYWNDLKSNIIIKLLAVCNVVTFKNYYADAVIFNLLFFIGPAAFYRAMAEVFPGKKWLMVCSVFLLPSFLFWCSGIHKDGLIFTCIALLIFNLNMQFKAGKPLIKAAITSLVCFIMLFALRNIICLLLLPALAVWYMCLRWPGKKLIITAAVYGACVAVFFLSPYLYKGGNLPLYAVEKQNEFKQLQGNSQIKVRDLQPNFISFVQFLPSALDIALLRPHIAEIKNASYLPAVAELFLLWFLAGLFIIDLKSNLLGRQPAAIVVFCFCFAFSYLLLTGYTVTFSGAVVRYKSIILPLLFCPLICLTNIDKNK